MADNVTGLPIRGKTLLTGSNRTLSATYGQSTRVEGAEKLFDDVAPSSTPGVKTHRTNRQVKCIFVRNASGIALLPKRLATWKAGYEGRQVDGYCTTDHARCAGVVDEHLPAAGVPANDMFWLAVEGPTLCLTDIAASAANNWSAGLVGTALTAATSQATTAGRIRAFAVTTNTTNAVSIGFNRLGRALTARTTANTAADILIDLNIMT